METFAMSIDATGQAHGGDDVLSVATFSTGTNTMGQVAAGGAPPPQPFGRSPNSVVSVGTFAATADVDDEQALPAPPAPPPPTQAITETTSLTTTTHTQNMMWKTENKPTNTTRNNHNTRSETSTNINEQTQYEVAICYNT